MVFEVQLSTVRSQIENEQWNEARNSLETLRTNVEERYATLGAAMKLRWDPTRDRLLHCLNHLDSVIEVLSQGSLDLSGIPGQKARCLRSIDAVEEI
jgi:hypothetical protein